MCDLAAFVQAIIKNDVNSVENILKSDNSVIDINQEIEDGSTALHLAVESQNLEMVELLLSRGASAMLKNRNGYNCLHLAVGNENLNITTLIARDGAVLNEGNKMNRTALHLAVNSKKLDAVKLLLDNKAKVNVMDSFGECPLFAAIKHKNLAMMKLLLDYKADPNYESRKFGTPFQYCLTLKDATAEDREKKYKLMDLLKNYGADINVRDAVGYNALHRAVEDGTYESMEVLIQLGMDVNVRTSSGGYTPLHLAAKNFNSELKIRLLVANGADLHAVSRENTPLTLAISSSNLFAVECLLDLGANPNLQGGRVPLEQAIAHDHGGIVECLLNHRADIHVRTDEGYNLLHDAINFLFVKLHKLEIIKLLLMWGLTVEYNHRLYFQSEWEIDLIKNCEAEAERLKVTKICEDSPLTYFDLLMSSGNNLFRCLRRKNIRNALVLEKYKKKKIRHFSIDIKAKFLGGLEHMRMSKDFLTILIEVFGHILPYDVVLMIPSYFNEINLKACFKEVRSRFGNASRDSGNFI